MTRHLSTLEKSTNGRILLLQRTLRLLSRLAPALSSRLAERLFLTPFRFRPPSRESEWAAGARQERVELPGNGPLSVWIWGRGERTVLLVHGWAGRGLQLGALARPLVERGFRVVTFDAPAHGGSAGRSTSLPELAAAIGIVAERFGPVEGIVAHSLGTSAALLAMAAARADGALRHSETRRLDPHRVVFIAPPSRMPKILDRFADMTGFTHGVVERMRRRIERRFGFRWDQLDPTRLAGGARTRALVIHDSGDGSIPADEGRELAESWPGATFVTTAGLGHYRILREPETVERTAAFLSESRAVETLPSHASRSASAGELDVVAARTVARAMALLRPKSRQSRVSLGLRDLQIDEREIARELAFGRD